MNNSLKSQEIISKGDVVKINISFLLTCDVKQTFSQRPLNMGLFAAQYLVYYVIQELMYKKYKRNLNWQ
jgi:hypothetical protein